MGFTVIEMIITLIISISLVLLGTIEIKEYREQLILDNTVREVKSSIEQAARICTIRHTAIKINWRPGTNELNFRGPEYARLVHLDSRIKISSMKVLQIKNDGSLSPQTITINNAKHSRKLRLQMLWGRAIESDD
ncbi:Prepilin-type cleavage/methylation protein [Lactobacillus sp. ESL0785]|uniref:Prepilin-type cleavage/methylation protein n=1 Tax=Lactobacillus sp. ESL0785 TaxID=2983232 RepID=UPI0023F6BD1F|nr:Prepilin-type cleavage/methylation protein [Lactobacillus sp. ESL0785]WEV71457.1 Prepilin-type cleavage/methylation protein [Lactobacillus sp. ESL0785]